MKRDLICVMLSMICSIAVSTAAEYYVSPKGNDKNSGAMNKPFKTITKAASIMEAGDNCFIMEGVYQENLTLSKSGNDRQLITFQNYEDDNVVVDATQTIDGKWTKESGGIYSIDIELPFESIYNTIYFNGENLDVARWPNNSDNDRFTFDGHIISGGSASHFEADGLPKVDVEDGYFCYLAAHSGTSWSREINSYKEGRIDFDGVDISHWPFHPHNPTQTRGEDYRGQLYLFGSLDLLDAAGEWYYDSKAKKLYAIFPDNADPNGAEVKYGARMNNLQIDGDYIQFDGVDFYGGSIIMNGDHCIISNSKIQHCSQSMDGLIDISAQADNASIRIYGSDILIENNLIEYGMACGVKAESRQDIYIHNNVIRYFNTIGIHANCVRSTAENTVITNNTIYTCGRDGISTFGRHTEIAYNNVYDCMRINNDGGVFYTVGNALNKDSQIHHNWFHDSYGPEYADGRAAGVYLDNHSKGYDVYNNVISNITWSGLMINWTNIDINFFNNTIWHAGYSVGRWAKGYYIDRVRIENNFSDEMAEEEGLEWIGTEIRSNIIAKESPFVSVEDGDFRPRKNSILIDAGTVIDGFTQQYSGNSPDVGAYEYGRATWQVGASWADEVVEEMDYDTANPQHVVYSKKRASEDDIFAK